MVCTVYILLGLAFTSTIIEIVRRQMVENLRKMQELRAQIQAQIKLAETLKKISENAGGLVDPLPTNELYDFRKE